MYVAETAALRLKQFSIKYLIYFKPFHFLEPFQMLLISLMAHTAKFF